MEPILEKLVAHYPDLEVCLPDIRQAVEILAQCYRRGSKVLICGHGGSAADSEHIVAELMKGYLRQRPLPRETRRKLTEAFPADGAYLADHLQGALPAFSLVSQTALLTAYANDVAPDMMFAQQVYGYGRAGDVVVGISTSGNSPSVLHALEVGRALGLHTLGLTGKTGGALKPLCDVTICVPWEGTTDVQERHRPIYHALCAILEAEFFSE